MEMGAVAEAIVAYVQPLIDQIDGSPEQLNKALAMGQLCYNLAILPEDSRQTLLSEFQQTLKMDDEEFDAFRRELVVPMIERHEAMFPRMHGRVSTDLSESSSSLRAHPGIAEVAQAPPKPDRYAPCPCDSGRKYKFCCGAKGR